MISWINGELVDLWQTNNKFYIVINCQGLGYEIQILESIYIKLKKKEIPHQNIVFWLKHIKKEDADYLVKVQAMPSDRIYGVETGGCPHTAIREDASVNLSAIETLKKKFPDLELILLESGGDNLAATFSPELVDLTIYVIDVCMGADIPRKKGPALMRADMLVVNKIELADHVNVDLEQMRHDTKTNRGDLPFIFGSMQKGIGVNALGAFLREQGGLAFMQ